MDLELAGKVAIVTGGSEGIARATVRSLAREGARVVACARRAEVLERAVGELAEETGAEIVPVMLSKELAPDNIRVNGVLFGRLCSPRVAYLTGTRSTSTAARPARSEAGRA